MGDHPDRTQAEVQEVQAELERLASAETARSGAAHPWEYQVMRWCIEDPSLRTRVLRFVDCLPALARPGEIVRHLREYFPEKESRLPLPLRVGLMAARPTPVLGPFTAGAVAALTRHSVSSIARLFIAGASAEEAAPVLHRFHAAGFRVSLDLLGEATVSQAEAEAYTAQYLQLIRRWKEHLPGTAHLSLKLSSLAFPFDPIDPEGAWQQIHGRLSRIFQAAIDEQGFVNVDMEQHHLRDLTLEMVRRLMERSFPEESALGVVIQSYLKDAEPVTQSLLESVRQRGRPITVRIVRGAYWDTELILSRQKGWPCPVFTEKGQTDACFERLSDLLLRHHEQIRVAIATHNPRSLAYAIVRARQLRVPQEDWECQMLYGMNEPLQQALFNLGIPLRIYTPVGPLIPGMAYLVRRILENTSQYSFLARGLQHAA